MIDRKELKNVEYLSYLGSTINDTRRTSEIQPEEGSFHHQAGLKFNEETSEVPHLEHYIVRC